MNRYSEGAFAPVSTEITAHDLPVSGRIPADLSGRYLRIGPNPLGIDDPAAHIWAAGEGMVHGVRIRDGRAEWYRNRWVRSTGVLDALGEPRRPGTTDPEMDFSPNTHVIGHAGRTFALVEAGGSPYELGYDLDTLGPCGLGATPEGFSANAHSKLDPGSGELHSVAYIPGMPFVQHIVTDPHGDVAQATNIAIEGDTPYMHDFALTENYVVVYDTPLVYDIAALMSGTEPGQVMRWRPDGNGRVGVLSRHGGPVRWIDSDPSHISHTLNAYEEDGAIVVDVVRADGPVDATDPFGSPTTLDRWTIDLTEGKVRARRLDDRPQDYPRVNDATASRRHRYGYTTATTEMYGSPFPAGGTHPDEAFDNVLVKHDLWNGGTDVHVFGTGAAVSEAAFAPRESGEDEDDGYLMTYVLDPDRGATDLVILSAQDFTGEPLARVHLPARVPLGLHGNWVADS